MPRPEHEKHADFVSELKTLHAQRMGRLEKKLAAAGTAFCAGDECTYADLFIYTCVACTVLRTGAQVQGLHGLPRVVRRGGSLRRLPHRPRARGQGRRAREGRGGGRHLRPGARVGDGEWRRISRRRRDMDFLNQRRRRRGARGPTATACQGHISRNMSSMEPSGCCFVALFGRCFSGRRVPLFGRCVPLFGRCVPLRGRSLTPLRGRGGFRAECFSASRP